MLLMTWDSTWSVNVKEIDGQHQRLIALINDLHDAMKAGKGRDVLGGVLTELANYTVYHFGTEEKLLQANGYPGYGAHKKEHETFTKEVLDLKSRCDRGDLILTINVMAFLKDWLTGHILKTDKRYSAFLNGKGVV